MHPLISIPPPLQFYGQFCHYFFVVFAFAIFLVVVGFCCCFYCLELVTDTDLATHTHTHATKLTRIPAHRFTLKLTLTESFVWLVFMTLVWMLNVIRFRRHNGPCNYPLCTPHHSFSPFFYPFPASLLATFYTICS